MSRIAKPSLSGPPSFLPIGRTLPPDIDGVLRNLLASHARVAAEGIDGFLEACGMWASFFVDHRMEVGRDKERRELTRIAGAAHRLLASLSSASAQTRITLCSQSEDTVQHEFQIPRLVQLTEERTARHWRGKWSKSSDCPR